MDEMWRANCSVIRQVLEKSDTHPHEIACVSCCGHGKGLYLWGRNQRPVMNAILSTDNRAWRYPVKWRSAGLMDQTWGKTYQNYLSCQPVALLAWLQDNSPGLLEEAEWIFACKDYVRFCLTGEAFAEYTDFSGSNLINLNTRDYDDQLLESFGLGAIRRLLPPLRNSRDVCGYVTGTPPGRQDWLKAHLWRPECSILTPVPSR